MDRVLAAILLFNNIANVMCATAATVIVTRLSGGGEGAAFLASLVVAFLILVLSEISPKMIGVQHATAISLFCARPLRLLLWLFRPVIAVANGLARGVLGIGGMRHAPSLQAAMNVAELASAVRESNLSAHAANDAERGRHYRMVEQLLRLADMPVEKIMTPRGQIEGIDLKNGDRSAVMAQLLSARHAKMPVFDGNMDAVSGFIDVVGAVQAAARQEEMDTESLRRYISAPQFIPAAANALRQMEIIQQSGAQAAFVVDGAGRVVGMVTMSNFTAAVLGEELTAHGVQRNGGSVELPGEFPLIKLGELHPQFIIPETSAASISGLILEVQGGNIPAVNSESIVGGLKLKILEIGDASIKRVQLFFPPAKSENPPDKGVGETSSSVN